MTTATIDSSFLPPKRVPCTSKKKLQGKDVGVPVRKMGLSYGEDMPTLWFNDNAFLTMFFTEFSATLPEGEAQFIHSVRLFQDKITDPILQAQVRAFIGQEGHHSREHDALNEAMLKRGLPLDKIEEQVCGFNKWMQRNQSPVKQLAGTVCGEHITALMADYVLNKSPTFLASLSPQVRTLWAWHCIEELEHKGVAFDVYDQLVGDRNLLRRTMVEMTLFFIVFSTINALRLMPKTGQLTNIKKWREAFAVLGKMVRSSRPDYMDFYQPDYHPWQHDCREQLKMNKLKYLGEAS